MRFAPFFIVGFERSGTTLLAVLLDRHSALAVTPETYFFPKVAAPGRAAGNHAAMLDELWAWHRSADLHVDRDRVAARFATMTATYPHLFQALLETYGGAQGKPRVGEKTPAHLLCVPRILACFPDARVVCIVRDGRDAVLSLLQMPWVLHRMARVHGERWARWARLALRYQQRYGEQFLLVRYEDLMAEPRATLTRVDQFLGVAFEEKQLASAPASDVVPDRERDWKDRATRELDPSRVGLWRSTASLRHQRILNSMMGGTLRQLGYGDTSLMGTPWLIRGYHHLANLFCRLQLQRALFNLVLGHHARRQLARRKRRLEAGPAAPLGGSVHAGA